MSYKLGLKPTPKDKLKLKFKKYSEGLPKPPEAFKQFDFNDWGMLGNDQYGNCVFAGAAHETMLYNHEADKDVTFNNDAVLSDYSAVTGFNPNDPSTDQGADMYEAAKYRINTGVHDASGDVHKIDAFADLELDQTEVKQAIYYFTAAPLGVAITQNAQAQFEAKEPWTPEDDDEVEGGHYVPAVGYDDKYVYVVTWGKIHPVTWEYFTTYADTALVYLSQENLKNGKSLEGFDLETLKGDLAKL